MAFSGPQHQGLFFQNNRDTSWFDYLNSMIARALLLSLIPSYVSQDATTIISEPMPDIGPEGRDYPGNRPFAEPGLSISNVGPCGMETYDDLQTNWNKPEVLLSNIYSACRGRRGFLVRQGETLLFI